MSRSFKVGTCAEWLKNQNKDSNKRLDKSPQPLSVKSITTGFFSDPIVLLCTYKGMERTRGQDYLATTFMDENKDEIKSFAWNAEALHFDRLLRINHVYHISGFKVYKAASFSISRIQQTKTILLTDVTTVEVVHHSIFPSFVPHYISVTSFVSKVENSISDVIGLVIDVKETWNQRGKEIFEITIVDESGGKLYIDASKKRNYFEMIPVTPFQTILGMQGIRYTSNVDFRAEILQDTIIREFPIDLLSTNIQTWMEGEEEEPKRPRRG